jgi:putative ABC transport system ATP-binding protein
MTPPPVIEFREISKIYGSGEAAVRALDGVSFAIARGEFVAIMGPSGSGKSTAMNLIGCLDKPSAGQYLFGGVDVAGLSRDQRALIRRNFLGFVFQGFNLLARTPAVENVELPLVYQGVGRAERRARAMAALERVGLADRAGHDPSQLSGGQQQRVAIARALVGEPKVILADEPTGNLDQTHSHELMQVLKRLNGEGLTIVMVTHEDAMAAYAARHIWLIDGRVEHDGAPKPRAAAGDDAGEAEA